MSLRADTGTLTDQAPVLAQAMSSCATVGQVAQRAVSAAAGGVGDSGLEGALDQLGGESVSAHQVLGNALNAMAQVVGGAAQTYTSVDTQLGSCLPTPAPSASPSPSPQPSPTPSPSPSPTPSPSPSPSAQPSPTPSPSPTP